jgi:hypothetical protein
VLGTSFTSILTDPTWAEQAPQVECWGDPDGVSGDYPNAQDIYQEAECYRAWGWNVIPLGWNLKPPPVGDRPLVHTVEELPDVPPLELLDRDAVAPGPTSGAWNGTRCRSRGTVTWPAGSFRPRR